MLQRLFIEINALKACLHHFSMANASFNKANKAVSNLLFTNPFLTSHHPFLMTISSRCRSCTHSYFYHSSLQFLQKVRIGRVLQLFLRIHKKEWKMGKPKNAIFDLPESFTQRTNGFFAAYLNICHLVFRIFTPFV